MKVISDLCVVILMGLLHFPGGSVVKYLPADAGGTGLILQSGRSPGVGGAWRATVLGVTKGLT